MSQYSSGHIEGTDIACFLRNASVFMAELAAVTFQSTLLGTTLRSVGSRSERKLYT